MSSISNFFKKLFRIKEEVHIELDAESIKKHHLINAMANERAEHLGIIARLKKEIGELRESEKDINEEDEVRIELNEQKKELQKKSYPKYFSLMGFARKLRDNKKLKNNLFFYDFQGAEKLAKYGDIGFSGNEIVLLDNKRKVIISGKNPQDIFWSVGGLETDINAKKIPLCLDENGGYVENPMVWEASELTPTRDGKFKYSKARKKPFYEYIKELMAEIGEKQGYIEELELTNTELQKENDDLNIAERVAEDSAETSREELGMAEKRTSAVERVFRSTERDLSQIRDINIILEDNLEKLEKQVEVLRKEAEREGTKLSFDKALETIQNIKRELVKDMPEKEIQIVEKVVEVPQQPPKK